MQDVFEGDARFRPLGIVGRGATGTVHRVFDRELETVVALKQIHRVAPEQVYRMKQEFRSLAGTAHPNLVQLHDLVVSDDACFFTMELVKGLDFVAHVRDGPGGDSLEAQRRRFHRAAPQLVRGLAALHAAGRIHRDVKPSNVLVETGGRVVILDFDLAAAFDEVGTPEAPTRELVGTLAYMAPEQSWGLAISPAADWYAAGVVLHEALTGRLPFEGSLPVPGDAPPDGIELPAWDARFPERLKELVAALLHPDPSRRPDTAEILDGLGAARSRPGEVRPLQSATAREGFAGRRSELALLDHLLHDTDGTRIAGVHGPSGIGKSALVRHFLANLGESEPAVVLAGRCHAQESVPYKGLDPIVDGLSRFLIGLDPSARDALLPDGTTAMARLFPVLSRLPGRVPDRAPGDDPPAPGPEIDPVEARRRGIGALRDVLGRIARTRPLVLWIDDAQWSDADSAALLGELLRPPAAPPFLVILSYRSDDRERVALLRSVRELAREFSALHFEEIELAPLSEAESIELARCLAPPELADAPALSAAIAEAQGSPFFLAEMIWHLRTSRAPAPLHLGDVISSRLRELPEAERRVLELIAVCGRPTERGVVLDAATLGAGGRPLVQRLEAQGFLRTTPIGDGSGIETYHDQIREAVASGLTAPRRSQCHLELARSFESRDEAEPELLAHHFHGGGDLPRAARHALVAADRAAQALAFLRAAELYRSAREWDPPGGDAERALLAKEADALAKAGHLSEGGRVFLEAAARAPRLESLELRRRAAEHLVSGGDIDEGLGALKALLSELGLRYPRSPEAAIAAIAWRVAALFARGIEPRASAEALDELERIRIDTCYGAGKNLVDVDVPRGIYFSVVSLTRALRTRDPQRLARSLCVVGGSLSAVGGPLGRLGERMMGRAEATAETLASPELWGTIDVARGQVLMLQGRSSEAVLRCDEGVRRLSEECQGYALECNVGRAMALRALEELGRMTDMEARAQELIDAAAAEGNRYAETQGSNCLAIARIARGDVPGARDLARHGRELWSRSEFDMLRLYIVRIQALCDLYEGEPTAGWERLREIEPELQRSGLLRIPLTRIDVLSLRAQLALGSAERDPSGRSRWLQRCEQALRRLERENRPDARLHARLLRAGIAVSDGDANGAAAALGEAVEIGDRNEMALRAACARLRLAELRSDARATQDAESRMRLCGVESPARWAGIYAPGFAGSAP